MMHDKTRQGRGGLFCLLLAFALVLSVAGFSRTASAAVTVPAFSGRLNGLAITLSVGPVSDASGYQILMQNAEGQFRWLTNLNHTGEARTLGVQGVPGRTYRFRAKAYSDATGTRVYSTNTEVVEVTIPARPTASPLAASLNYHTIRLSWQKVGTASGYEIYQAVGNGSFRKLHTVPGNTQTSLAITGKEGTNYRFRIRPYVTLGGRKLYAAYSSVVTVRIPRDADLFTPEAPSVSGRLEGTDMVLTWSPVSGADGYEVLRYTGPHFRWVSTLKGAGNTTYRYSSTSGSTEQFKVKAYRDAYGTRFYSPYSHIVTLTIPATGSARKALVVGDSRTYFMKNYSNQYAWPGRNRMSYISAVGQGYNWLVNTASAQIERELDVHTDLFLWLGVNDLYLRNSYLNYYKTMISKWKAKGARVYLLSVGPVQDDPYASNEEIEVFNEMLQTISGATYLNVYEEMTVNGFNTLDGIHYDADTTKWVYDLILSVCGS